jgi:transposase-like protein
MIWAIAILAVLLVIGAILYWVARKEESETDQWMPTHMPPPHSTLRCPKCGDNRVEGVYGDEHQRFRCGRCGKIFQ